MKTWTGKNTSNIQRKKLQTVSEVLFKAKSVLERNSQVVLYYSLLHNDVNYIYITSRLI